MAEQPVIVEAPSSRSKCKACAYLGSGDPTIQVGTWRVGIPGHAAGVTVYHWCHPSCFAEHCVRVDRAPTGRAKCKSDQTLIPKDSIRLLIGYKKESTIYKLDNAPSTIIPRLVQLVGRSGVTVHGLSELSLDERQQAEGLIFGGSVRGAKGVQSAAAEQKQGAKRPRQGDTEQKAVGERPKVQVTTSRKTSSKSTSRGAAARRAPRNKSSNASDGDVCD